jgi:methyl-accepting chemotaxis protein
VGSLAFFDITGAAYRMVITSSGNVGIGLTNPSVPLHVMNSGLVYSTAFTYFSPGSNLNISGSGPGGFAASIYAAGSIVSAANIVCITFSSFSDVRIKKNIETYPSNIFDLLLQFRIVSYDHIDFKNGHVKAGLVAQEVEQIVPSCVNRRAEYIPNIYSLGTHSLDGDNVVITVVDANGVPKDVSGVEIGTARKISLKLLKNGTTEHDVNEEIITQTSTQFTVRKWENYCADDKVFVYGTEVDDFRVLDKDVISMMGIKAIQELAGKTSQLTTSQSAFSQTVQELAGKVTSQASQIQELSEKATSQATLVQELAVENTQLKSQLASLEARLAALESK